MHRKLLTISLGAVLGLVAGACGGSGGGEAGVEIGEFSVFAQGTAESGEVVFTVDNTGDFTHELAVVRSDLLPGDLPQDVDGGADEAQLDVVGRTEIFEPGTETLTLDLDAGAYVLICNIVFTPEGGDPIAHYDNGMRTGFTVGG